MSDDDFELPQLRTTGEAPPVTPSTATPLSGEGYGVNELAELVPLHVLERIAALPWALRGDVLHVAVADPANLHGIDELRLATRHPIELGVASREDILAGIRRLVRASEAFGARAAIEEEQE